ncbi:MAG: 3-hydroxyisobutyrate dehydrogenase [Alphaproteobacteria bacterium]|nr:3-hydroxyisobutyrate dehydrogenase [Alphaproteobacteria bacterium]
MTNIGFIGLGNMGGPMAENLVKAGHHVTGFDLSDDALAAFKNIGGIPASSSIDAVIDAEIVITMLPAGKHVDAVYCGENGLLTAAKSGTLFLDSSTIDVETARKVAKAAADANMQMMDTPVSGGVAAAAAGTLTFMCGGSDAAFAKAQPILEIVGGNIIHAGASGTGQAAKICNNMMLGIQMISVCEAFAMADALGLERQKLFDISSKASGQCWSLTTYCPVPGPIPTTPANNDYEPGFAAAMMLKDLRLAADAAQSLGVNTQIGQKAKELYEAMSQAGLDNKDFSAYFEFMSQK